MIQAFLAGNLGGDAELRAIASGETVLKFSVACKTGKKNEDQWVKCAMWGERAQKVAQYLTKGTRVAVSGRVSARAWAPKDGGEPKCDLEVRVDQLTLLGGGDKRETDDTPWG